MEERNPELESFRQQWKAEVLARAKAESANREAQPSAAGPSKITRRPPAAPRIPTEKESEEQELIEPQNYHALGRQGDVDGVEYGESFPSGGREPQSALEHYEKAVERETQGSLGDSLALYRKAFKVGSVAPLL